MLAGAGGGAVWASAADAKVSVGSALCQTLGACLVCGTHVGASNGAGQRPGRAQWPGAGEYKTKLNKCLRIQGAELCV